MPRVASILRFTFCALMLVVAARAAAHLPGLIPDRAAVSLRARVRLLVFFGHPFEGELMDTARPERLQAHLPSGAVRDLLPRLEPVRVKSAEGREALRFRADLEAEERGDVLITLASPLRFEGEDDGFVSDLAKAVVHVQAEKGWERALGERLEIVPLTRPYGQRPGVAFLAKALFQGRPLEGARVEYERFNATPPARLPEAEFITRSAISGPGGLFACTLDSEGWWAVTVSTRDGSQKREGKDHPITLRATFWLYVGEPLRAGG